MSHVFGKGGFGGFLGREFSLKNLVPNALTIGGALVGGPIGAGLGRTTGELIEGQNIGQAATSGLGAGALDYATAGLGNALQGTDVGNALSSVSGAGQSAFGSLGSDISSGLGSLGLGGIGTALSGLGSDVSSGLSTAGSDLGITGTGGLTSDISSGWNQLSTGASNLFNGPTATQALTGSTVSNPALASTLENVPGNVASTAANAPTISQGGGGILSSLFGGGGGTSATAGAGGGGLLSGFGARDLLAAAPLALDALRGNQAYKGENQLSQSAAQLSAQGAQLQSYIQTGTLPPGAQAAINQAVAASQASIRSQYASMGGSGSSAEAQDLANAQAAGVAQATQTAQSLLSTGIQQSQLSDQLYQDIMNQSMQEDQDLSGAFGTFASALPGGPAQTSSTAAPSVTATL